MKHLPSIVLAIISALSLSVLRSDAALLVSDPHGVASQSRALYLGGGGPTGQSWQIGMLKGLKDAGIDLTSADLVIGVSAGSVAAVQALSGDLDAFYEALLQPPTLSVAFEGEFDDDYLRETTARGKGLKQHQPRASLLGSGHWPRLASSRRTFGSSVSKPEWGSPIGPVCHLLSLPRTCSMAVLC